MEASILKLIEDFTATPLNSISILQAKIHSLENELNSFTVEKDAYDEDYHTLLTTIDHRHQSLLDGINNNFKTQSNKLENFKRTFQQKVEELEAQLNTKNIPAEEVVQPKQENESNAKNRNM